MVANAYPSEVGLQQLGVTCERIRQIEAKRSKLRHPRVGKQLRDFCSKLRALK